MRDNNHNKRKNNNTTCVGCKGWLNIFPVFKRSQPLMSHKQSKERDISPLLNDNKGGANFYEFRSVTIILLY